MNYKNITIIAFVLTCLAQLYIPGKMIWDSENVLGTGTAFKFRTAPVDPNDPFRGKFIILNYRDNEFPVKWEEDWHKKETVFVHLTTDADGFAKIKDVTKEEPIGKNYVEAYVDRVKKSGELPILVIEYPFDRFYMQEFKAPAAEELYREAASDTSQVAYALVHVKRGNAVLEDVVIGDLSVKELAEEQINDK